jgi:DNA-binding MarR family transcriptional regulator
VSGEPPITGAADGHSADGRLLRGGERPAGPDQRSGDGGRGGGGEDLGEAYRLLIADVYELAGRSRATSEALARSEGQTVARWHLMSAVSDGPRSVASAARRLGLQRQSVQRTAGQLVNDGLATLAPDPDDARAPLLSLTDAGHRALARLFAASDRDRAARLAAVDVTADDLARARSVLRSVAAALE